MNTAVLTRDEYTCLMCGCHASDSNVSLHAAHVVPEEDRYWKPRDMDRFALTLCEPCHKGAFTGFDQGIWTVQADGVVLVSDFLLRFSQTPLVNRSDVPATNVCAIVERQVSPLCRCSSFRLHSSRGQLL